MSALLTVADYYGTLAAARCLGERGVAVTMADDRWLVPALWSKHVARRVHSPPTRPHGAFLDWLLDFGAKEASLSRRHALYPTSDDLAWLFAANERELAKNFRLYAPPLSSIAKLLDKKSLLDSCKKVGLLAPKTYFPSGTAGDADFARIAREARFPLLVKPRMQVLLTSLRKGRTVEAPADLADAYRDFREANVFDESLARELPGVEQPMLQEMCDASGGIYSISGFYDPRVGMVARASLKVLQWPRRVGVGICFEDAELEKDLAERVQALCEDAGYKGVFEVEFVRDAEGSLLIDFNPRFFGQMAFDHARELPSAYLAYLGAREEWSLLAREVEKARAWRPEGKGVFCNRVAVGWTLALEAVTGGAGVEDAMRWHRWWHGSEVRAGAVADLRDPLPELVDAARYFVSTARHPRSLLRSARARY